VSYPCVPQRTSFKNFPSKFLLKKKPPVNLFPNDPNTQETYLYPLKFPSKNSPSESTQSHHIVSPTSNWRRSYHFIISLSFHQHQIGDDHIIIVSPTSDWWRLYHIISYHYRFTNIRLVTIISHNNISLSFHQCPVGDDHITLYHFTKAHLVVIGQTSLFPVNRPSVQAAE